MRRHMKRRTFLKKTGAAASLAAAYSAGLPLKEMSAEERIVKVGFVGVGRRGTGLFRTLVQHIPGVEMVAVCDIVEDQVLNAQKIAVEAGKQKPEGYTKGPEDYRRLCDRDDLDAVITATPWELHAPVSIAAMKAGKYAATEVNAGITMEQCWELVRTSEETEMPCMMLENVCYFRNVMLILNILHHGLLGELIHGEAGYQHYVVPRGKFYPDTPNLRYRGKHAVNRNGNLYPTHQVGPLAQWMNINRGNRFEYMVSMSSKARGMNHYVAKTFGPEHKNAKRSFANGDINVSLIRTANGETLTIYHDTQLPRPYDLILRIQGTEGIIMGYAGKIHIEGRTPGRHRYEDLKNYQEEYEHPIWKKMAAKAQGFGHGGSDFLTLYAFIKAVRERTQTPIDVYDSATWSAVFPLSEISATARSKTVDFPDFTGGKWRSREPMGIVEL